MDKLALFCSGSGTNAQAIIHFFSGHPTIQVCCLLANTHKAYALERAHLAGLPTHVFSRESFRNTQEVDDFLHSHGATCLVLAGFLWLVPERLLQQYPAKVINIHPALLPDFGGPGMYGHHVHQAVAAAKVPESGITIHLADEAYDRGKILTQVRTPLAPNATPTDIENAVRALELQHYARSIEAYLTALTEQRM
jgi:phosphoribosylglycinamide formyltransferase-1